MKYASSAVTTKNTSAKARLLTIEATNSRMPEPTSWDSCPTAPDTPSGRDPSATLPPVDRAFNGVLDRPAEGSDRQRRHDRDGRPHDDADHKGRTAAGPAPSFERRDGWQERRGQGDRDHDRTDHDRKLRQDGDREPDQADGDEQSPTPLRQTIEPGRDVALHRHARGACRPEHIEHGPRDRHHDGDRRHRDEHAGQATHRESDQEREEDDSRVQPEGAVGQVRRQPSLLDDLEDDHDQQEQERGRHSTERKTGEQQDPGHEEAADVGDEPRREHEHRQGPGERYADQGQDDEAQHRIHGRDHGGSAHIAARSAHRLLAGVADPVALPAAKP